jgi:hypothetical protein
MKPTSLVAVLLFLVACFSGSVRAQIHDKKDEIPIERCDRLPVVTMKLREKTGGSYLILEPRQSLI